jgi:hypothetical protein
VTAYRFSGRVDSQAHWDAIKRLAVAVAAVDRGAIGQRGPGQSPLLNRLAELEMLGCTPEIVAAWEMVNYCARGGDWDEAIEMFRPRYPNEPDDDRVYSSDASIDDAPKSPASADSR